MSSHANHYVIYGFSLTWVNTDHLAEENNDRENTVYQCFEKYSPPSYDACAKGEFVILDDGRDGRFLLMGICVASTEEYGNFDDVACCEVSKKDKKLFNDKIAELRKTLPSYFNFDERIKNLKPKFYVTTTLR